MAALRRVRGQNGLRGQIIAQPDRGRVLIEVPSRGEDLASHWITVTLGPYVATVVAQLSPREQLRLADFTHEDPTARMDAFAAGIASAARRGLPYTLTVDDRATYKPGFRAQPPA